MPTRVQNRPTANALLFFPARYPVTMVGLTGVMESNGAYELTCSPGLTKTLFHHAIRCSVFHKFTSFQFLTARAPAQAG
jgi:hypothetical protein